MSETMPRERTPLVDVLAAVLLGVVSVLTAFASWQVSVYADRASDAKAVEAQIRADGTGEYLRSVQTLAADTDIWGSLKQLDIDAGYGMAGPPELVAAKRAELIGRGSDALTVWMEENSLTDAVTTKNPFRDADSTYYLPLDAASSAAVYLADTQALDAADADGRRGSLAASAVVYAVALFLLGLSGTSRASSIKVGLLLLGSVVFLAGLLPQLFVPIIIP
jgi:hypothetical protein